MIDGTDTGTTDTGTTDTGTTTTGTTDTGADAPPEWMGELPDEMKANVTLKRYADVPALAKAHIEAHKVAKSKVIVPGADADEATMGAFFDAIGRPATAEDYDIAMPELPVDAPEDARTALAEEYKPFRALAHKIGLNSAQAKALSEFEIERQNAYYAKGAAEIAELKTQLGRDYAPKLEAAQKIAAQIFGDDEEALQLADDMDRKVGSARYLKGMMRLAEIAGEHGIVHSDAVEGFGEVKDAEAKLTELQGDKSWRDKFEAGDVTVVAQRNRLLELAQQQALRGNAGRR